MKEPAEAYYRRREAEERAAGDRATDTSAAHVHYELAGQYQMRWQILAEGNEDRLTTVEEFRKNPVAK